MSFIGGLYAGTMLVLSTFASVSMATDENWYPSRYGAEDRIGALNNLSPETVIETAKLITSGKVYSLAVETNEASHDNYSRFYRVKSYPMTPSEIGPNKFTANESLIVTNDGLGTTIDGFAHPGIGRRYYNGATEKQVLSANLAGVLRYGMESIPPIVSRGILLDMAKQYNVEALSAGVEFNSAEIAGAARAQGLEIRKGDVVLFHTGWLPKLWEDTPAYLNTQPGLGVDGARYLVKKGIALVGIDARTIEAHPAIYKEIAPVHQELITKNGIHIIEHVDTRALHNDKINEFMFVLGIPKLRGAIQAIVNPIAIK